MLNQERETPLVQDRAELDAMVERLARSPRLANLLRYIGDKYFQGAADQIREYSIAIDVFGRPRTFDPSQDAIARVEAHRLRKKLKEFYETEGKDRPVQIVIPMGSYVPAFVHRPEPETASQTAAPLPVIVEPEAPLAPALPAPSHRIHPAWWVGAACLLVTVYALWATNKNAPTPAKMAQETKPSAAPLASGVPGLSAAGAVRFIAGYDGPPHVDPSGIVWGPDRYFERGGGWRGSEKFTARTNDQFLYQTVRTGEFAYDIPLKPGIYELHLHFVEPGFGPGLGGGENSRTFDVMLNGKPLLQSFDIEADAMGPNIADVKVFRDVEPASDGKLHLNFAGVSGKPIVSAIELIPGTPHKLIPIRFTTQANELIDHDGQVWGPDNYFYNGQPSLREPPVTGTPDPNLYAMERYGHFNYAIPVDTRGEYSVTLHFAEFYFGPQALGHGGAGSRVFNVNCNGVRVLDNFDIFKEVGSFRALSKTFRHIKPSPYGKLNLEFEPSANYANVSAIEVLDESR